MSPTSFRIEHQGSFWHRIVTVVAGIVRTEQKRVAAHRAERHLSHMSDRMLADIGISRAQIPGAVIHGRPVEQKEVPYWSR